MRETERLWAAVAGMALAGTALALPAGAVASGPRWGTAIEVPGIAALNTGGAAMVRAVSCPSSGNCGAGGFYVTTSAEQAFVVNESGGTWGQAEEVPGLAALNTAGDADLSSVSCPSPGNCTAGGFYSSTSSAEQGFVVDETGGTWGQAQEVPGLAALNAGKAEVVSVSCASAGNCAAGGFFQSSSTTQQAFVVNESGGTWGQAEEVPGLAALNTTADPEVESISCPAPGDCAAGGYYNGAGQGFIAEETTGVWAKARPVPGLRALNTGGQAEVESLSCASPGDCAATGPYYDSSGEQAFVASRRHAVWGKAEEVPGLAALNVGSGGATGGVAWVSCASPGNCAAAGQYGDSSNHLQVFVVIQARGAWSNAEELPGLAALEADGGGRVTSLSCASARTCVVGGWYNSVAHPSYAKPFVADLVQGAWQPAELVPGLVSLDTGRFAQVVSVACAPAGTCAIGGIYAVKAGTSEAFVDSQK
jgi:hypothetical protein